MNKLMILWCHSEKKPVNYFQIAKYECFALNTYSYLFEKYTYLETIFYSVTQ